MTAGSARQGQAAQDVKLIAEAEVHAIHQSDYWLPGRCDALKPPLDLVRFDTAVNMGVDLALAHASARRRAAAGDCRAGPSSRGRLAS